MFTTTVHDASGRNLSGNPSYLPTHASAAEALAVITSIPGHEVAAAHGWTVKVWERRNVARHDGSRFYTAQVWVEVG